MDKNILKNQKKARRVGRVRKKVSGSLAMPRMNVSRTNKGMYIQLIDDATGKTLVSVHSKEIKTKAKKIAVSLELGKLIAKKASEKKIEKVVFDRGGNKYHGRIKSAAEGAREGGLKF